MSTCYTDFAGSQNTSRRPNLFVGATLQTKERRVVNVCYIFGSDPDRYLHCHSHRIVLYNLWEKKIAAHYCNSERLVNKTVL